MATAKFGWYAAKLAVVMMLVFVLQNIFNLDSLALDSSKVLQQPWTLVTYIFLHGNVNHIASNLFSLVLFGLILEKIVDYRNFLITFFLTGIASGVASVFFYPSVIGASGAIFGIIGLLVVIRPKMVVPAFGIPIPMAAAAALWVMFDLGGIFYPSSVANIGHIGGLLAGIVIGFWLRPKYKVVDAKKEKIKLDENYFREWEEKYMKRH